MRAAAASGSLLSRDEEADPEEERTKRAGVLARPETLQFAGWLASNASQTAQLRMEMAFVYSGSSSGTMDSIAQVFSQMVRRFQDFLHMQEKYASPRALQRLEKFVSHTSDFLRSNFTQKFEDDLDGEKAYGVVSGLADHVLRIWSKAEPLLSAFRSALPASIAGLKKARAEVSKAAKVLDSAFTILGVKAPPVFHISSRLYRAVWIGYFSVFSLLTLGVLYFAFYASGYLGASSEGSEAAQVYEAPRDSAGRFRTCLASCTSCFTTSDSQLCFWSCILLVEVLWLVMFIVSFALLLVIGVKAFVGAGCAPVYMLGNPSICSEALHLVSAWLGSSTWLGDVSRDDPEGLLVCKILTQKFGSAVMLAAISNLFAAVFSFMLILESAMMHERKRCAKLFEQS